MKARLHTLAFALAVTLGSTSFAVALPGSPRQISEPEVIQAQFDRERDWRNGRDRWDRRHMHRHRDSRGEWRGGHRYRHAPPGWRRYSTRPWDWRGRGCISIGPAWFCP
jgi:Ni/Co efflux regulator RcnB